MVRHQIRGRGICRLTSGFLLISIYMDPIREDLWAHNGPKLDQGRFHKDDSVQGKVKRCVCDSIFFLVRCQCGVFLQDMRPGNKA